MPTSPCLLAKVPDYKKGLTAATGLLGPYGQAVALPYLTGEAS